MSQVDGRIHQWLLLPAAPSQRIVVSARLPLVTTLVLMKGADELETWPIMRHIRPTMMCRKQQAAEDAVNNAGVVLQRELSAAANASSGR